MKTEEIHYIEMKLQFVVPFKILLSLVPRPHL